MLASLSRKCGSEVWTVRQTHREDKNTWMEKPREDPFQRSRDAQKKGMHGLQGTGGGISLAWEEPHQLRTWTRKLMQGFRSQKGRLRDFPANNCCQLLRVKKAQGRSSCREGESWKRFWDFLAAERSEWDWRSHLCHHSVPQTWRELREGFGQRV